MRPLGVGVDSILTRAVGAALGGRRRMGLAADHERPRQRDERSVDVGGRNGSGARRTSRKMPNLGPVPAGQFVIVL